MEQQNKKVHRKLPTCRPLFVWLGRVANSHTNTSTGLPSTPRTNPDRDPLERKPLSQRSHPKEVHWSNVRAVRGQLLRLCVANHRRQKPSRHLQSITLVFGYNPNQVPPLIRPKATDRTHLWPQDHHRKLTIYKNHRSGLSPLASVIGNTVVGASNPLLYYWRRRVCRACLQLSTTTSLSRSTTTSHYPHDLIGFELTWPVIAKPDRICDPDSSQHIVCELQHGAPIIS